MSNIMGQRHCGIKNKVIPHNPNIQKNWMSKEIPGTFCSPRSLILLGPQMSATKMGKTFK